jgi:CheY-like chemotaxis protein
MGAPRFSCWQFDRPTPNRSQSPGLIFQDAEASRSCARTKISLSFFATFVALRHLLLRSWPSPEAASVLTSPWIALSMTTAKVLVVDDNPTSLALVSFLLRRRGHYEVLSTPDPNHALEIVRSDSSLKVVVSDMEMPGLRGPELVRAIKQTSPGTGCVLMSAGKSHTEELPSDVPLLSKPIDAAELFSAVKRVLSESIAIRSGLGIAVEKTAELRSRAKELKGELDRVGQEVANTMEQSIKLQRQK